MMRANAKIICFLTTALVTASPLAAPLTAQSVRSAEKPKLYGLESTYRPISQGGISLGEVKAVPGGENAWHTFMGGPGPIRVEAIGLHPSIQAKSVILGKGVRCFFYLHRPQQNAPCNIPTRQPLATRTFFTKISDDFVGRNAWRRIVGPTNLNDDFDDYLQAIAKTNRAINSTAPVGGRCERRGAFDSRCERRPGGF